MMIIVILLAVPIGVAAAIYLEEFAPKNKWTDLIEVNINNLAAVPSIVFGLLGAAVFILWFKLPLSAPVVGGLVLMFFIVEYRYSFLHVVDDTASLLYYS